MGPGLIATNHRDGGSHFSWKATIVGGSQTGAGGQPFGERSAMLGPPGKSPRASGRRKAEGIPTELPQFPA